MFGNWHNGIEAKTKARICIDVPLYVGPYESCNNIVFNKTGAVTFCRLSIWLCTGYNYDFSFSRRTNENLWLLAGGHVIGS
jgi:hypothetical protein